MPVKLTPKIIKTMAAPATGNRIEWDTDVKGLGIRMTAARALAFVLRYVVDGRQRVMTLGGYPELSITAAREIALGRKAEVLKGGDPLAAKAARRDAETLGTVVARYFAEKVDTTLRPRTQSEARRILGRYFKPIHHLPLRGITRAQVAQEVRKIAADHGPIAGNRARSQLSALFSWAMRNELVDTNPVHGSAKPAEKETRRERTLAPAELGEVWQACRDDDHGRIVRLLMLTGQRREEVAGMRWSEVDLDKAVWSLPRARAKNDKPHDVPLSDRVLAILAQVEKRDGRELLFGEGEGSFSGWSRCKARLDERIETARRKAWADVGGDPAACKAMPAWTLHDLRRTAVTGMVELGVLPHVVEAVVNHISGHKGGVAGIYNRATYAPEKRSALTLWAEHVAGLAGIGEPKVISLEAARQRSA